MRPLIAVPAVLALVYRAISHKSLTPAGILVALLTAVAHAIHPWSVFFALLAVFFLAGSHVTKIKHDVKSRLTLSSTGTGEGPRSAHQVLANSLVATILVPLHALALRAAAPDLPSDGFCFRWAASGRPADVLVVGIVAGYAAVAADTFSSELGILSREAPRLVTRPWRTVPRGTNGAVTAAGVAAGLLGAAIVAGTATGLLTFCGQDLLVLLPLGGLEGPLARLGYEVPGASKPTVPPPTEDATKPLFAKLSSLLGYLQGSGQDGAVEQEITASLWDGPKILSFFVAMILMGLFGTLLDSVLGAILQASVVDSRTGKVVEGSGGGKVLVVPGGSASVLASSPAANPRNRSSKQERKEEKVHHESRSIEVGLDILSNNGVNLMMALVTSLTAMGLASWYWGISLEEILEVYVGLVKEAAKPYTTWLNPSVANPFSTLWD